jgi:hypothetical protein
VLKDYYRENVRFPPWVGIFFLAIIAFLFAILVFQSFASLPGWWNSAPTAALLILIGFFVLMALVTLNFVKLGIVVDSEEIRVSFGKIRKTIPWNEVVSCEVTKARFGVYGGVGIRLGVNKSLAFTSSLGNAVRIMRTDGLPFVFSTKNPAELSRIINKHLKT